MDDGQIKGVLKIDGRVKEAAGTPVSDQALNDASNTS